MEPIKRLFTKNLVEIRKDRGLTQEQLAEKIGISLGGYQQIEYGKSWPMSQTMGLLCAVLKVRAKDFFNEPHVDRSEIAVWRKITGSPDPLKLAAAVLDRLAGISPLKRMIVLAILFEKPQILEDIELPSDFARAVQAFAKAN